MNLPLPKFNQHLYTADEVLELCEAARSVALKEVVELLKEIEAGYGVTDRGLSDEEYKRMKQTAREHCVHIKRLEAKE